MENNEEQNVENPEAQAQETVAGFTLSYEEPAPEKPTTPVEQPQYQEPDYHGWFEKEAGMKFDEAKSYFKERDSYMKIGSPLIRQMAGLQNQNPETLKQYLELNTLDMNASGEEILARHHAIQNGIPYSVAISGIKAKYTPSKAGEDATPQEIAAIEAKNQLKAFELATEVAKAKQSIGELKKGFEQKPSPPAEAGANDSQEREQLMQTIQSGIDAATKELSGIAFSLGTKDGRKVMANLPFDPEKDADMIASVKEGATRFYADPVGYLQEKLSKGSWSDAVEAYMLLEHGPEMLKRATMHGRRDQFEAILGSPDPEQAKRVVAAKPNGKAGMPKQHYTDIG